MEEIMILEFSVSNYRSFKEKQTLSFEPTSDTTNEEYYCHQLTPKIKLLKFAILYGSNASGKTNILRALSFLRHIAIKPREMEDE
ncbi:MAG TPA: ATP-binding protein, partial [Candidatus Cloacimonas sp.]|nr:ATP-binding protein [Candidatus Cloacimonas sp.]